MNKSELVRQRLAGIEEKFGPAAAATARAAGAAHNLPACIDHGRIDTMERAAQVGAYLAEYGNHPSGMTPCEVAGLNGDAAEHCPFAGEAFCTCGEA